MINNSNSDNYQVQELEIKSKRRGRPTKASVSVKSEKNSGKNSEKNSEEKSEGLINGITFETTSMDDLIKIGKIIKLSTNSVNAGPTIIQKQADSQKKLVETINSTENPINVEQTITQKQVSNQQSTTVLSRNGYRINKKLVDKEIIDDYKKELTVKPMCTDEPDIQPYPLFRETPSELIVPKYYGVSKMGPCQKNTLKTSDTKMQFTGQLRDFQTIIVDKAIKHMKEYGGGVISVPCGRGKSFSKGTLVIMYDGSIKEIENINVGDLLMGDDSTPREVKGLGRGHEEMFDIISIDGGKYTVNRSHILSLKSDAIKPIQINGINYNKGDIIDISVDDYLKLSNTPLKGFRVSVEFPIKNVSIDPYIFGYWLGHESPTTTHTTAACHEYIEYFSKYLEQLNTNKYKIILKDLNVLNNKHIPNVYKCNSREIRLATLAGILDSIGNLKDDRSGYIICLKSEKLMNDIIYLARSLGFVCIGTSVCSEVTIHGNGIEDVPVKLSSKKAISKKYINDLLTYDIIVKSKGIGEYYGIEIDKNRRFLLADFTVTHNTVMALKIACELKVKTLVVVHKTFLQDQWIERIKQFTDAIMGIIRQNKIQVKNMDIIVGMMQSISMKDYNPEIFNDIGLVIFDECLPYAERIITINGNIPIGELYNLWKEGKDIPHVKSFNDKTKRFEFKKVTYAWEKKSHNLVKVTLGNKQKNQFTCTSNHKILTTKGYKEAIKLTSNDILLGTNNGQISADIYAKKINNDQEQIIIGSFLGNGSLCYLPNKRYIIEECHEIEQKEYCEWKASMFDTKIKYTREDNYLHRATIFFNTKEFDSDYDFPNNKITCPQWLIDKLDFKGIVIWFLDCGILDIKNSQIIMSTSFDEDSQIRLVKKLNDLNINSYYFRTNNRYRIVINQYGTEILIPKIYPYIHESMKYKFIGLNIINHKIFHLLNQNGTHKWNNKFEDYGTCRVISVIDVQINIKNENVYDIEVEDNHNFVVSGCNKNDCGTIVHNCHHTPARIFSNSLYKLGAKYTLGLSATPQRNDGLTKVIHWYLGDFIHQEKNTKNKQVIVKMFHFKSNDPLFREKKKWPKFKPDVVKMTTNICSLKQRTKHIVDIINNLRKFHERKILILDGRKSHLLEMKNSVDQSIEKDIANEIILPEECKTYLYTGDSTKQERKDAETSGDILFATYDLAHEGLDIERLNTIIFATPKRNIIQAVGRIMRRILKNGDVRPLVIDIADELSIFSFHSECRISQYNKGKYRIEHYYLKNDKIITFDTYMQQEQNLTQEEIDILPERVVYDPKLSSILDMQRVNDINDNIICDVGDDENNYDNNEDDLDSDDNDDDNYGKIIVKSQKINNSVYMF